MALAFKTKNYIFAAYLSKRFLKLAEDNPDLVEEDVLSQAQKILAKSEKTGTNEFSINFEEGLLYDVNASQRIDPEDLVLISKAEPVKISPLTKSVYRAKNAGKVCKVCQTCIIGKETVGLKIVK